MSATESWSGLPVSIATFTALRPHVDLAERQANGCDARCLAHMLQDLDAPLARDDARVGFGDEIVGKRRAEIPDGNIGEEAPAVGFPDDEPSTRNHRVQVANHQEHVERP